MRSQQFFRHERLGVAMALAEHSHHTSRGHRVARAREPRPQTTPIPKEGGVEHFFFGDDLPPAAKRPAPLVEMRPQAWVAAPRNPAEDLLQILDAPVPHLRLGEELERFLKMPEDVEQLIKVPKILPDFIPRRAVLQEPQTADQLVDVPQISPARDIRRSSVKRRKRRTGLWPMLGSTARRGADPQGSEPGHSSAARRGADPHRDLQGGVPGQGSTANYGAEHQGLLPKHRSTAYCGAQLHGFLLGHGFSSVLPSRTSRFLTLNRVQQRFAEQNIMVSSWDKIHHDDFVSEDEDEEETDEEQQIVPHSSVRAADDFKGCQVSGLAGVYWRRMGTSDTQWDLP